MPWTRENTSSPNANGKSHRLSVRLTRTAASSARPPAATISTVRVATGVRSSRRPRLGPITANGATVNNR